MRFDRSVLTALLLVGCAPALPSETPLGEGPLAKKEAEARAKAETDAAAKQQPATVSTELAATEPPPAIDAPPPPPGAEPEPPPQPDAAGKKEPGNKEPGKKPGAVVVYAGEYIGSDTSTYKMEGNERTEKDDKARTRVEGSGPEISVTFIDSNTGKDICTIKGKTNGKNVSFAAGQKCWGDGPGMSGTLTSGSAKFEDKKLTIDMDFDLVMGEGQFRMTGQLHYHFEGTRP
jgi:hypothetical protein